LQRQWFIATGAALATPRIAAVELCHLFAKSFCIAHRSHTSYAQVWLSGVASVAGSCYRAEAQEKITGEAMNADIR
jgi:hypothetical protein